MRSSSSSSSLRAAAAAGARGSGAAQAGCRSTAAVAQPGHVHNNPAQQPFLQLRCAFASTPTVHVPLSGEHMQPRRHVRSMGVDYVDAADSGNGFLASARRQRLRAAALPPAPTNPLDSVTEPLGYSLPKGSREGVGNDYIVNWQLSGGHRVCPAGANLRNPHPRALLQFTDAVAGSPIPATRPSTSPSVQGLGAPTGHGQKVLQEAPFGDESVPALWTPGAAEMDDAKALFGKVTDYLSQRVGATFLHDGAVGAAPGSQAEVRVRVVSDNGAHAQFLRNVLPQTKLGKWATEWAYDLVVYDASFMARGDSEPAATFVKAKKMLLLRGVRSTAVLQHVLSQVAAEVLADASGAALVPGLEVVGVGAGKQTAVFGLDAGARAAFWAEDDLLSAHATLVAGNGELVRAYAGVAGLDTVAAGGVQPDDLVSADGQTVTRSLGARLPNSLGQAPAVVVVEGKSAQAFSAAPADLGLTWASEAFVVTVPAGSDGTAVRNAVVAAIQDGGAKAASKDVLARAKAAVAQ